MSQNSKVPTLRKMVGVLITMRKLSLFSMLQIPKRQQSQGAGACPPPPRPRGKGKDLNDLTRMVTGIEGRQPGTSGAERWSEYFQQKIMLTVLGESTPTTAQGGGRGQRSELLDIHERNGGGGGGSA